jgi:hypothetical protein
MLDRLTMAEAEAERMIAIGPLAANRKPTTRRRRACAR